MVKGIDLLAVSGGAIIGANCRYLVYLWASSFSNHAFKWGTFLVNMSGALAIGVLAALITRYKLNEPLTLMLTVGLLGSYTTFSAFSAENLRLLQDKEYALLLFNSLGSVIIGIALVFAGFAIGSRIFSAPA